jgi:hypothetical protein
MRGLLMVWTVAALLTAATTAGADDPNVVRTHNLEVKERLQYLELIKVTSEKPANPEAEALDAELLAILEEAALTDQSDERE